MFLENGLTDRHDEANNRFSQFCEKRVKNTRQFFVITLGETVHNMTRLEVWFAALRDQDT
jgi:hypothetical protein